MLAFLLLAIAVDAKFEAGQVGKVEQVSETHFRCEVPGETDQDHRNAQPSWFYFRMDGVAGRDITVDLTGLNKSEYDYRPSDSLKGLKTMRPVYSYDNRNWEHFKSIEIIENPPAIRLQLHATAERVWIARIPPYTNRDLRALLDAFRRHPHLREEVIGKTVEGRPMPLLTVTNPKTAVPSKKVIWLMTRQHSWESGTSWVAEGALRFLLSAGERAVRIRDRFVFKIIPVADPDGVARGGVRFNKNGYDLNRNWDTVDRKLMPEIWGQRKAVLDWVDSGNRIDLFLSIHNTEAIDYIATPLEAGGPELKALAQRFWKLLDERTKFYSPRGPQDARTSTAPGTKGRMMVNQGLFHERKIPAFLMELMVDSSPKLSRPPTVGDRLEFGAALVEVLCDAVADSAR